MNALWTCPDCAFTFDAVHTDSDSGGYSCPACAETSLRDELNRLRAKAAHPATTNQTTTERLKAAWELLDAERRHLYKAPFADDESTINEVGELVASVLDMVDEIADAVIPHMRHLAVDKQHTLTNGWVLYDRRLPATWPPARKPIMVRQYHHETPNGRPRYQDQRRGIFEHGRLSWRVRGYRPLAGVYTPCGGNWIYAWREEQ